MKLSRLTAAALLTMTATVAAPAFAADTPQYQIIDLGTNAGNLYSQANSISSNGAYVTGRSIYGSSSNWPTFIWNQQTGMVAEPNILGRLYEQGYGVNDSGRAVGVSTATAFGSGALPVMWQNGVATQLALANGASAGRAYAINNAGIAVGSVGSGNTEIATIFNTNTNTTTVVTALSSTGSYLQTAFGINSSGLVAGNALTTGVQNRAAVYDSLTGTLTEITSGNDTSLAFAISDSGYVVGSIGNAGTAFIWSAATGVVTMPYLAGTSNASARDVNDQGWAVGTMGGQYAAPFLYANSTSYSYADIVTNGAGWNFATTTDASAMSIANDGTIVGTAELNGVAHAYKMVLVTAPVPEPGTWGLMAAGLCGLGLIARRRNAKRA